MVSTWPRSDSERPVRLKLLPGVERDLFIQKLGQAVAESRAGQTHLGLMLVDLTNLARINHYHGYDAGDEVLQVAYSRLLELSKLPDAVHRVGSHRFSFVLPDLGNPAYIALAMNRVHRAVGVPLPFRTECRGRGRRHDGNIHLRVRIQLLYSE